MNTAREASVGTHSTDGPLCTSEFNTEQHFTVAAVGALICADKKKKGGSGVDFERTELQ